MKGDSSLFRADDIVWGYPIRMGIVNGRVYEKASEDAPWRDITDELPVAEPCQECEVCDDPEAWK